MAPPGTTPLRRNRFRTTLISAGSASYLSALNRHTADRVVAIGDEVIRIHRSLRRDLVALRDNIAAAADSDALPIRGLPAHCLAFCSAVTVHHTDENTRELR